METDRTVRRPSRAILPVVILVLIVDVISKIVVRKAMNPLDSWWLVKRQIGFEYVRNSRLAFNLGPAAGWSTVLILVAIAVLIGALLTGQFGTGTWVDVGTGLILGGAIGNAIDRLTDGSVVDFIAVNRFPRFNLADSALTIGIGVIVFTEIVRSRTAHRA